MALEKYQFKIEGAIIQTPEGWKDFTLTLKRDEDISGILVSSTNRFTFWGDGYDILKQRFDANYNDKVNVSIDILQADKTYQEQYKGVVILTDAKFNLEKRFVEATIEDANFQGAIQGNKNVKTFLDAGLTKNGEIVDVPEIFDLDYFNAAGVYQGLLSRRAYLLKGALDFLVRFMTDDVVKGVQSDYLDDVDNWEGVLPYITTGLSIRQASQEAPNVSFLQLIVFLQRTHDLTFDFVTNSDGDPVMRIEEKEFFFQSTNSDTIRDITDLSVKVDSERIFSHLEVGNNTVGGVGNCSLTTRWFSFQKEDYSLRGKGNIDKLLDLTTDFITDSNAITGIVSIGIQDFDDDIIIVLGLVNGTQAARFQDAAYCSNNFIYNLGFTNDKIIDRQLHSIPNSVSKYLTAATTPAKAELGDSFGVVIPTNNIVDLDSTQINYIDESYDLGGNYNTSDPNETFYDIPFTGEFSFDVGARFVYIINALNTDDLNQTNLTAANITYRLDIERFDSSFSLPVKERVSTTGTVLLGGVVGTSEQVIATISATMSCESGDRIKVRLLTTITDTNVGDITLAVATDSVNTFFKCLGSEDDAGTFEVFDPNSFRAKLYTFEKNLSLTRTDNIRLNTRNSIIINELSDTDLDKTTWIEQMVNNIETDETSFIMIK